MKTLFFTFLVSFLIISPLIAKPRYERTAQHDIDDAVTAIVLSNFLRIAGHIIEIGIDPDNPDNVRPHMVSIFDGLGKIVDAAIRSGKLHIDSENLQATEQILIEYLQTEEFKEILKKSIRIDI
jgi:hypothetical protein